MNSAPARPSLRVVWKFVFDEPPMKNETFRRKLRFSPISPAILHRRITALRQV